MKRRIFFWLERLKITPAERKTLSGLMILLMALGGTNLALSPSVPFEGGDYHELEKQFNKRTAELKAQEQALRKQYFPSSDESTFAAATDTTEEDSSSSKATDKSGRDAGKPQININEAGAKKLQELPGIGPTYARRIIAYRKDNGAFKEINELKKIDGIAEKRLENLKPFVKLTNSN